MWTFLKSNRIMPNGCPSRSKAQLLLADFGGKLGLERDGLYSGIMLMLLSSMY